MFDTRDKQAPGRDASQQQAPSEVGSPDGGHGPTFHANGQIPPVVSPSEEVRPGPSASERAFGDDGGVPLPVELRRKFEASTGADLSQVRVHTGAESQQRARAVGAQAYTIGQDIHFGAGQYDPASASGQQLIAHEVAHTVQQQGAAPVQQNKLDVTSPGDATEVAADRAADAMVEGSPTTITTGAPATIARFGFDSVVDIYNKLTGKEQHPAPITSTASGTAVGRPPTPPEYKALDPDIVEKLWQSRSTFWVFKDKTDEQFWDGVRAIGTADLYTLVQVTNGAKRLGLWGSIKTIRSIYTYSGSNGIKFDASGIPPMASGQWGKDIQSFVRKEHGDIGADVHEWHRQNSGAGNPGMHLGLDAGAGNFDLHWDPTNPMQAIGTGAPQLVDTGLPQAPAIPVIYPRGQAIYSPWALAQHAIDIGKAGQTAQHVLGKKTRSEKMLDMSLFESREKAPEIAKRYAQLEADDLHVRDRARADRAIAEVRRVVSIFETIGATNRDLAMQDESEAGAAIDQQFEKFEAAKPALWNALAALLKHLHAEVPGYSSDLAGFDNPDDWGPFAIKDAEKQIRGLQAQRAAAVK